MTIVVGTVVPIPGGGAAGAQSESSDPVESNTTTTTQPASSETPSEAADPQPSAEPEAPPSEEPSGGGATSLPTTDAPVGPEITALRTAFSKTYPLAAQPGKYHSVISAAPVHYKDAAGAWKDIDTSLVTSLADGRIRSKANAAQVDLAVLAGDPVLARVTLDADHSVAYGLQDAGPATAAVAGSVASYRDALPGVSVELTSYWAGLKEDLVLASPAAADTFVFPLTLRGLTAHLEDGTGDIVYRDASGTARARTPHGTMEDSRPPRPATEDPSATPVSSRSDGVDYELLPHGTGTAIRVTLDRAWLDDPARVYPVRVDPSITFNANTDDTYVATNDTSRNDLYGDLNVGTENAGATKYRSFIHFDTAWLKGRAKGIDGARIATYLWGGSTCTARPVSLYRVTQGWWGGNMTSYPGANVWEEVGRKDVNPCPNQWVQWDQTGTRDMVHNWVVSQAWEDHGVMLKAYDEGDNSQWRRFYSANQPGASPHLVVDWWGLPNTPDSHAPGDGTYNVVPTLSARYTHSDESSGGTLWFDIYNEGGGWVTNGAASVCHGCTGTTVPSTLPDGRYQWDAIGQDGAGRVGPRSGRMWFSLDRPPDTPDQLSPATGVTGQAAPTLSARYGHADPGNTTGQVVFRIYSASDTLLSETYSASLCKGCTATHLPAGLGDGLYKWEAVGYDSGGTSNPNAFSAASERRTFRIDNVAPTAPVVTSSSHPDQTKWYPTNAFAASWTPPSDPSGIAGYSVVFDQVGGTVPGTAVTRTEPSFSSTATNGQWYLHVRAVDNAGNVGTTRHFGVRADSATPGAPTVASSTHPNQNAWTSNPDPTFTWSGGDTTSGQGGWSYVLDQVSTTDPDTLSEGTFASRSYTALSDGVHWFHVKGRNNAGAWGPASAPYAVRIDATAPSMTSVSSSTHPDPNTWYGTSSASMSWSATDLSGVDGYSWVLDQAPSTTPDTTSEGTGTSITRTLADGEHWLHVRARNGAGTWGSATHLRIRVDAVVTAPTVTSSSHPSQTTWYAVDDVALSFAATEESGVTGYSYTFDGVDPDTVSEGTVSSRTYADMPDGAYTFKVRVQNGRGQWSPVGAFTARVDTSPAIVSALSSSTHPNETLWYPGAAPALSWSSSDTSGIVGYSYVLDSFGDTTPDTVSEGTTTTRSYTALADGVHWFHVRALNGAGQWGPTVRRAVRVDGTVGLPTVSSTTHPTPGTWYSSAAPALNWTTADESGSAGYSYTLDQVGTTVPDTTSEGTVASKSYSGLADGVHWFHVRSLSGSGVWSATTHFAVHVDTTSPTMSTLTSTTHPDANAWYANAAPSLSWTASDTSGVVGYSYVLDAFPDTVPDTTSEGTATTKSYTALADGRHWFHVRARNGAGAWGPVVHRSIGVDTSAPVAPPVTSSSHPDQASWYTATTAEVAFATTDDSGVDGYSYVLDQAASTVPDTTSEGAASTRTYTGLANGVHHFHVRARNSLGMWGATTHFAIRVDTSAGAPTVTSSTHPSQSAWYASGAPSLAWAASYPSGVIGWSYVLDQSASTVPDVVSEGTATTKSYSGLADGTHWFHVRAQTGALTWGATAHFALNVDGTPVGAPTVSSSTHPNQAAWYPSSAPALSFPATDTSGVTGYSYVLDQVATTTPDAVSEGGSSTRSYTGIADGVWYFHVRAANGSGLWGVTSHYTLRIDAGGPTAPPVSSSTHPDQATWYQSTSPALSFATTDTSGVTGYSYVLDQVATTVPDSTSEGTATTRSYTGLADGVHWFHVRALNGAGTWGDVSHFAVRIDASAPIAPPVSSSTHPNQTTWYANSAPQFAFATTDTAPVDGYSYVFDTSSATVPDTTSEGAASSAAYPNRADGTQWFHVRARNASGIWGGTTHFRINIDASAPAAPTVASSTHSNPSAWYSSNAPTFSFSASDTSGIVGYSYMLDQNSASVPDTASEGTSNTKGYSGLADGVHWFHVRTVNSAGLWSDVRRFAIQVDTTAPPVPSVVSTTHPDPDTWYPSTDAALSWDPVSDTSGIIGYSWSFDRSPTGMPDNVPEGTATDASTAALWEGVNYFHVRAVNGAGLGGPVRHMTLRVDAVVAAPVVTSSSHPDPNAWYASLDAALAWTNATEESGLSGYAVSLTPDAPGNPGETVTQTEAGVVTRLPEDRIWFVNVRTRNGAGAWSATASRRMQGDESAPAFGPLRSSHSNWGQWYADDSVSFEFEASDVSGITGYSYVFDQNPSTDPDSTSEGLTPTTEYADVDDGKWWFHIAARNGAGTWNKAAHLTVWVDVTPPNIEAAWDSPESPTAGDRVRFHASWDRSASPVRGLFCMSDVVIDATCEAGAWAVTEYGDQGPVSADYETTSGDIGQQTYFAFVCDAAELCSNGVTGYFDVVPPSAPMQDEGAAAGESYERGEQLTTDYYPYKWHVTANSPPKVWNFMEGFPSRAKPLAIEAAKAWTDVDSGRVPLKWTLDDIPVRLNQFGGNDAECEAARVYTQEGDGRVPNVVKWGDVKNRSALASVFGCTSNTEDGRYSWVDDGVTIAAFMTVDKDKKFWYGDGQSPNGRPSELEDRYDLLGVLTHEWGHMNGFKGKNHGGHFSPDSFGCDYTNEAVAVTYQTMCPTIDKGTNYVRELGTSDKREHRRAYQQGQWIVAADGGVFAFGDAGFFGSMGGSRLNQPMVGIAGTKSGNGYWTVASDGGIFSFGDAMFRGSMGGTRLNQPIVGMAADPDGDGYWLVARDGGIFSFNARFHGSLGGISIAAPIVDMVPTPDGGGYWLVGADGWVYQFGNARFMGTVTSRHRTSSVVGITAVPDGSGYWIAEADGRVWSFGSAGDWGNAQGQTTTTHGFTNFEAIIGPCNGRGYMVVGSYFARNGTYMVLRRFGEAPYYGRVTGPLNGAVVGAAAKGFRDDCP